MDVRVLFGKNVARLRASRGLSQTQLVFLLDPNGRGISQSYLSQLEAGKRDPKLSTIVEIAMALGVKVEELVAGFDTIGATHPSDAGTTSASQSKPR